MLYIVSICIIISSRSTQFEEEKTIAWIQNPFDSVCCVFKGCCIYMPLLYIYISCIVQTESFHHKKQFLSVSIHSAPTPYTMHCAQRSLRHRILTGLVFYISTDMYQQKKLTRLVDVFTTWSFPIRLFSLLDCAEQTNRRQVNVESSSARAPYSAALHCSCIYQVCFSLEIKMHWIVQDTCIPLIPLEPSQDARMVWHCKTLANTFCFGIAVFENIALLSWSQCCSARFHSWSCMSGSLGQALSQPQMVRMPATETPLQCGTVAGFLSWTCSRTVVGAHFLVMQLNKFIVIETVFVVLHNHTHEITLYLDIELPHDNLSSLIVSKPTQ